MRFQQQANSKFRAQRKITARKRIYKTERLRLGN